MADNSIGKYASQEIELTVSIDLTEANVYATFVQDELVVLEKNETEMTVEPDKITLQLSQEDTSKFSRGKISFQIKYVCPDGSSDFSEPIFTEVVEAYKKGVLEYVQR